MHQKVLVLTPLPVRIPQDFYRRADIGIIKIHIHNENEIMDAVSQMLDGGTVFGNFDPEARDIPPDDEKDPKD